MYEYERGKIKKKNQWRKSLRDSMMYLHRDVFALQASVTELKEPIYPMIYTNISFIQIRNDFLLLLFLYLH